VLRQVGTKKKFFIKRVGLNKALKTQLIYFNVRSTCLNYNIYIYFNVPPLSTQYRRAILYNTYIIYTLISGKLAINLFIYPPSKSLLSTCLLKPFIYPPLLFNSLNLLYVVYYFPLYYKGFKLKP